jgi:6-pyruvoyltetrahydropterin/6-carboxytetrahydropterin synthase
MQTITRKGTFDSMHRVMNERMKCFNIHGHTYLYELEFEFTQMDDIGYALDFKEIKRVMMQWIDDYLDHGSILNPVDAVMIETCNALKSKMWLMSLNGIEYCNPSVENIAKEVFLACFYLCSKLYKTKMWIKHVRIYETPNCFTDCSQKSIRQIEFENWVKANGEMIHRYAEEKGVIEYDDRKIVSKSINELNQTEE